MIGLIQEYWRNYLYSAGFNYTGLIITLWLLVVSIALGFLLAVPLSIARASRNPWVSRPVWFYTYVFCGTPLYVQLLLCYTGIYSLHFVHSHELLGTFFRSAMNCTLLAFTLKAHMTVLDNIIEAPLSVLGLSRSEAEARARKYLTKVGLSTAVEHKYPSHLSGGQQQRVAIARALAMEPEVMLFDEPTSALDPELVGEVLKVMQALAEEGRTMIVVTHEMGFARNVSNHVVFLHKGKIEEQGDPREVLNAPRSERLQQFLAGRLK